MSDSDLPQGWSWIPLGELIQPVMTREPSQEPNLEFSYFDIGSIDNELGVVTNPKRVLGRNAPSRARRVVEAGDVLFSTVRPYLRGIAQVPINENGVASTGFCVLRPENSISAKYLYYLVRSDGFLDRLLPLQRGASYPAVREVDVLTQLVPVAPMAEQNRIVEKLEELLTDLDAGVAELKVAQKKLSQYRQSLLNDAIEGSLTTEWRAERALHSEATESGMQLLARILTERRARWEARQLAKFKEQGKVPSKNWQDKYPEPVQPGITDLPTLPDGWVWASLDQLVGISSYGTSVKCGYKSTGVPVLRIPNIVERQLDLQDLKFAMRSLNIEQDKYLARGDILVVRTNGSIGLVGCASEVVNPLPGDFYFASYLLRLRCIEVDTVPSWISAFLASSTGRTWIESRAVSSVGLHNISLSKLLTMPLPLAPLSEQSEALRMLDTKLLSVEGQEKLTGMALSQSDIQRNNIIKSAFFGQLVSQDPNDEPASVLLERISAERKERERQPKLRKMKIKKEISAMVTKLKDVLADAADWIPAQEAFRRCGVADSAHTDQVEALYAELRELDKNNQLAVESVKDAQCRKLYDQLKFIVTT